MFLAQECHPFFFDMASLAADNKVADKRNNPTASSNWYVL